MKKILFLILNQLYIGFLFFFIQKNFQNIGLYFILRLTFRRFKKDKTSEQKKVSIW